nr:MAG TPA: hypothetical protein [Caudoviricetes sp.]
MFYSLLLNIKARLLKEILKIKFLLKVSLT